ncbi:hypothetical protein CJF31_00004096 [Rutstroemia sp. NJR-2017a BVV2]|nr:hypothetical protein CJF31_00004096 [Rutstroemia sp. NJR-2017a BVV2]
MWIIERYHGLLYLRFWVGIAAKKRFEGPLKRKGLYKLYHEGSQHSRNKTK